jgi:hypothetical protein
LVLYSYQVYSEEGAGNVIQSAEWAEQGVATTSGLLVGGAASLLATAGGFSPSAAATVGTAVGYGLVKAMSETKNRLLEIARNRLTTQYSGLLDDTDDT